MINCPMWMWLFQHTLNNVPNLRELQRVIMNAAHEIRLITRICTIIIIIIDDRDDICGREEPSFLFVAR